MDRIVISNSQISLFLLVFFRVAAILLTAPLFGAHDVPVRIRIIFAFTVSVLIYSAMKGSIRLVRNDDLILSVIKETILGISIGLVCRLIFSGVQLAGQLIDNNVGFGLVNIVDPSFHNVTSITANLYVIIATLVFILTYGYHYVLLGIAKSFERIPLGELWSLNSYITALNNMVAGVFSTGLRIAIPVVGAVFLANIALAIVARTMPQMNVFVVGFPLQIAIGLLAMAISIPLFTGYLQTLFLFMRDVINSLR